MARWTRGVHMQRRGRPAPLCAQGPAPLWRYMYSSAGGVPTKDDSRSPMYEQQLGAPDFIVHCTLTRTLDPQSPSNVPHTQQRGREEFKARKEERKKEEEEGDDAAVDPDL